MTGLRLARLARVLGMAAAGLGLACVKRGERPGALFELHTCWQLQF